VPCGDYQWQKKNGREGLRILKNLCYIRSLASKQIVSSGSDKPLAYAQDKQQFDWLQVLKQRHQASPEQF